MIGKGLPIEEGESRQGSEGALFPKRSMWSNVGQAQLQHHHGSVTTGLFNLATRPNL